MLQVEKYTNKIKTDEVLLFVGIALIMLLQLSILGERHDFPDSITYMSMSTQVSGGYPFLIWLFKKIFGLNHLFMLAVFQNILASYAIWKVTLLLKDIFKLRRVVTVAVSIILIVPFLFTVFFTHTKMCVTNSILTEGITVSSYLLVACFIIRALIYKKMNELIKAAVLCFCLILIRPQMVIPSLVVLMVAVYLSVTEKKCKQLLIIGMVIVAVIVGNIGANALYRKLLAANKESNSLNSLTVLTNVFYASDRASADLFDGDAKELFIEIYDALEEKEATYNFAKKGLLNRARHIEEYHDAIKLPVIYETMHDYIVKQGITEETKIVDKILDYSTVFRNKLLLDNFGTWLYDYLALSCMGLIRTNSIDGSVFVVFSVAMYLLAIVLTVYTLIKFKRSNLSKLMLLVWLMIFINAFGVATTIMCLSRYMIYNMSFFYIMLLLGFLGLIRSKNVGFLNIEIKEV